MNILFQEGGKKENIFVPKSRATECPSVYILKYYKHTHAHNFVGWASAFLEFVDLKHRWQKPMIFCVKKKSLKDEWLSVYISTAKSKEIIVGEFITLAALWLHMESLWPRVSTVLLSWPHHNAAELPGIKTALIFHWVFSRGSGVIVVKTLNFDYLVRWQRMQ